MTANSQHQIYNAMFKCLQSPLHTPTKLRLIQFSMYSSHLHVPLLFILKVKAPHANGCHHASEALGILGHNEAYA